MDILNTQLASVYYVIIISVFLYMTFWFWRSVAKKRSDLADEAWGPGFILIALVAGILNNARGAYLITLGLVALWGLRLFYHIQRRHKKTGEDARYLELTKNGKKSLFSNFVKIFLFQGLLMIIVASPVVMTAYFNKTFSDLLWFNYLGIIVWTVGFWFESTADSQLKEFVAIPKNKGRLMTEGLWKYSRHPNYFGEITMWWGIWLFAYTEINLNLWIFSGMGPLLITLLICFVSGIPMLEKKYVGRNDWTEYAKKTSVLVPWFVKK